MDVEGHEPEALEGMGIHLKEMKPTLLIEVTSEKNAAKVETLLSGLGYRYYDIDEKTALRKIPHVMKSTKWNLLFCQEGIARSLGLE